MKTIVRALSDRSSHWRLRDPLCWLKRAHPDKAIPISAELAKKCRALAIKAHPTERAGSRAGAYAQAQRSSAFLRALRIRRTFVSPRG